MILGAAVNLWLEVLGPGRCRCLNILAGVFGCCILLFVMLHHTLWREWPGGVPALLLLHAHAAPHIMETVQRHVRMAIPYRMSVSLCVRARRCANAAPVACTCCTTHYGDSAVTRSHGIPHRMSVSLCVRARRWRRRCSCCMHMLHHTLRGQCSDMFAWHSSSHECLPVRQGPAVRRRCSCCMHMLHHTLWRQCSVLFAWQSLIA